VTDVTKTAKRPTLKFRRMKPKKTETRSGYLKRFREEASRHLRDGRPSADPRHELAEYGGMNRKERRQIVFGSAVATRYGGEGKFTKPTRGGRRARNRARNAIARASRRRNRA
jgi:hypothetical protein